MADTSCWLLHIVFETSVDVAIASCLVSSLVPHSSARTY